MKVHAICMVPSLSELVALSMSKDRIVGSLLNMTYHCPATFPQTHAICMVSLLLEQAALVHEKNRFRHSRPDKLFQWLHVVAAV
jgi:hypothetical protein